MRRDVTRRLFRGRDLAVVAEQARRAFGDDVVLLNTVSSRDGDGPVIEVVAAPGDEVERFRRTVEGRRPDGAAPERPASGAPRVIALVGPTGAGKTTTLAKLAIHREAFGPRRTALVTLDTYRAGAVAQLETYAHVARLPFDVVYDVADATRARERLREAEVILVDTPGRGPKGVAGDDPESWRAALDALAPDEVHLVLPATIRPDIAEAVRERFDALPSTHAITHCVLTKLDEVPGEEGVSELAARLALPVRWVTDGQEIPVDLVPGPARLVEALGAFAGVPSRAGARVREAEASLTAARITGAQRAVSGAVPTVSGDVTHAPGGARNVTDVATSRALDRPALAESTPRRSGAVAAVPRLFR